MAYGWANALADIGSAIIKRNADRGAVNSLTEQYQQPAQDLPGADQWKYGPLGAGQNTGGLPNQSPFSSQTQAGLGVSVPPEIQQAANLQPQQPTQPQTLQDFQKKHYGNIRGKALAYIKTGMSPIDAARLARSQAMEAAEQEYTPVRQQYQATAQDELGDAFSSGDARQIMAAANKYNKGASQYGYDKADTQMLTMAIRAGAKSFTTQQEQGEDGKIYNVTYAQTPDGQMAEVHRGLSGANVSAATDRIRALAARNNASTKSISIPGMGSLTMNEYFSQLNNARPKRRETTDIYGNKTYIDEGNPEVYNLLRQHMPQELNGQPLQQQTQQSQGSIQDVESGYIQEALSNNISPAQIAQGIRARMPELQAQGVDVNALLAMVEQPQQTQPAPPAQGQTTVDWSQYTPWSE
ncbi:hypothetical protein [Acetonema longum]|uniref:Uncharacterized protein n=1 Tax=Acetonema longum DSM 6540 TaxID=1009370 RepID=F7NEI6_9FIRM|nr:hypothetical protein [Acetonema longum]EGO65397.1 hypothetical protein ALO_02246 [Acetonema longum DSM 6540]